MFISVRKDETSKIVFSSFTDDNWLIVSFFTDEVIKITLSSLSQMTQQNLVPHLLRITTWSVGCDLFHRWSSKINVVICLVNWYKSFWQVTQQNLVSNILRITTYNVGCDFLTDYLWIKMTHHIKWCYLHKDNITHAMSLSVNKDDTPNNVVLSA